ncbi:MAG TPA: LEA type 2 family protein [Gammaproteobacteria bacterium]
MALVVLAAWLAGCATVANRDPLNIAVAGIEPLPSEGLELRLAVAIRVQNPNDRPLEYTGVALTLDLNGRRLATGVSDAVGVVPRYGESVFTIPVTISAFDMARQVFGFANAPEAREVRYRVRGKLEGGLLGTRRFNDEGSFELPAATARPPARTDRVQRPPP